MFKKLILLIIILISALCPNAQVPQALNYQAIARNTDGTIIPGQNVGVRFSILDGSITGSVLYQETHQTITNNFGLFTLAIGKGTIASGTFPPINWGTGDKFLKVEIAPQGGANYAIQGVTQLLSVPYALYAEKTKLIGGNAISITNGNTINANYLAGAGININGNTISATAGNSWLLNGNVATSISNFLGTTDNQPLRIRTNNINRFTIDEGQPITGGNYAIAYLSDFANITSAPAQLQIYGKDVPGVGFPLSVHGSVAGMTWAPQGGGNNTLGRLVRLTQFPGTSYIRTFF